MDDNARLGNLLDDYGRAFHAAMTGNGGNGTQERADSARKLLADFALRSVPAQGMVMVPREPTEAMMKSADKALWKQMHSADPSAHNDRPICLAVYRAMLSAAESREGET